MQVKQHVPLANLPVDNTVWIRGYPAKRAESQVKSQARHALNKATKQKASGERATADGTQNAGWSNLNII
jgi:hypothetical protein